MKRAAPHVLCLLALLGALVLSVALGSVPIPLGETARILLSRLPLVALEPGWEKSHETIVLEIRLPAAVLLALTGAALGGSGAAYQGLLRNPLADPYLIGVAPGAGLGAILAMVFRWPPRTWAVFATVPTCAFLGALAAVALVYSLARVGRTTPVTTLVLAGVAVGAFANAVTSFLMIQRDLELRQVFYYLLGGFALGGWEPVLAVAPYIVLGLGVLVVLGRPLNVLQFGDEQAEQLGLPVEAVKLLVVVAASLAAAAAVAFSGIIGFVGLVVPHLLRLLAGHDYRRLIPLSALGGGAALLLADALGRSNQRLESLPVGVITALLGAPFFLVILRLARERAW